MSVTDMKINDRWPASDPSILQLYSFPTPNGKKASIMLEEIGIPYEPHLVRLGDEHVRSPEFLSLSPNNKIPAIIDPDGPDGTPIGLFESGAILIYLAEKTGKLLPGGNRRYEVIKWLMWQMGGLGPMLGQFGYFHKMGGKDIEDPRPHQRFTDEAKRLLNVVNGALDGREWVAGDYSIADIAIGPWLQAIDFYDARDTVGWDDFANLQPYVDRFAARPAVQRGSNIPPRPED